MSPSKPGESSGKRVIVVTGSYKGIGFEVVRLLCEHYGDRATVYMTARDATRAQPYMEQLKAKGLNPAFAELDITSKDSVMALKESLEREHNGVVHCIINNAGMAYKRDAPDPFPQQASETIANNYFGYLLISEVLYPIVANDGCVINVASMCGKLNQVSDQYQKQLSEADNIDTVTEVMNKFVAAAQKGEQKQAGFSNSAYGMSKLGMIAAGRVHAKQLAGRNIAVLNMCPGWCKSDMAGWERPPKTAAEGADTVVWLETMTHEEQMKRSGGFFQERKDYPW